MDAHVYPGFGVFKVHDVFMYCPAALDTSCILLSSRVVWSPARALETVPQPAKPTRIVIAMPTKTERGFTTTHLCVGVWGLYQE